MARVRVLDPTAAPPEVDPDPGPDAGPLAGRTVGVRFDRAWRSWLTVLDEWVPRLEAAGATVERFDAGNRIGDEGERTAAGLERFAASVDVALVGLGN
jgi:hypothetical protein